MPIDFSQENLKTFAQAARLFPSRRENRPVSPITLWRWYRRGVSHNGQRVHLEAIRTPSGLATSVEAVKRFLATLNTDGSDDCAPPTKSVSRDVTSAVEQLDADGV